MENKVKRVRPATLEEIYNGPDVTDEEAIAQAEQIHSNYLRRMGLKSSRVHSEL